MTSVPRHEIHVLHVDDNVDFVETAATFLEGTDGLTVTTETSPTAALDHLTTGKPPTDCIVSDYEMPDMNGLEFLERIREEYPDLPFILYTGKGSEEIASEAISAGVTDYLQKEGGTDQYTLLANRIKNAVSQTRSASAHQQAEARLQALTTNSSLVVLTIDETSTIEYANDAVERVLGYHPHRIHGEPLTSLIPDRLEDDHLTAFEQYLQTGEKTFDWSGTELSALHADGHEVRVEVSFGETVIDGDRYLTGVIRDISDHSRHKQLPEERPAALDTAIDGIAILDEHTEYTHVNQAYADIYGYDDPDAFIGETWQMCYTGAELVTIEETVMPTLEAEGAWRGKLSGRRRGGTQFPQQVTLSVRDDGGMVCVVRDITEQKSREHEPQCTSALLSTLVENIPAGILAEDNTRQVLFTNREFTELFGIDAPPAALVGSDCEAAAEGVKDHFVDPDRFIETTNDVVAAHASIRHEEFELVDGRTFERSGTPVPLAGEDEERTGYLWVYHDITELKRAENRFRALFEHLPDPGVIVELTEEDAITRAVNAAFEDVFGYPAETAVDASLNDLIVPPDYTKESEEIDQQARSGEPLVKEVRRQTADGEIRDFLFRNVLIETVGGAPRAHGIYTDITDRKQRERRLNALHEATRELMAADTREKIAEIASQAASEILDLPLNGVHLYDEDANGLVPLAASPRTRESVGDPPTFRAGEGIAWQVFESGEPRMYADIRTAPAVHNPETPIRSELLLPLGDHGVFLIGSMTVDDFDETDVSLAKVLTANVGIALDRTDRVQALATREQAVAALHDATRRLMNAQTEQEIATIALEAAEDTLGFPLVSIRELDTNDAGERRLVPVEISDAAYELLGGSKVIREGDGLAWEALETGDVCVYENVTDIARAMNAGTGVRSLMILPVDDYGTINAASTRANDFDNSDVYLARILAANVEAAIDRARREQELRIREEELQRQNDRLDEFAGVVSHDLRNPLTVARGWLDLAKETGELEHFEAAERAHDRIERIIEDVLTLARQGDTIGETQPIALNSVARTAWENVDTGTATLTADTDRTIDGDASRVSQLFENLFRNSVEHGGEEVTVRVGWLADRAGFYVEDTGPGIPPEVRPRVFESGFTTETEGTGFGLAIVSEIAVAHGWEIEVTEAANGGARVEIVTETGTS